MAKKKKKTGSKSKERPLLSVQGVVRLHHSFVSAESSTETMRVIRDEEKGPELIQLKGGQSEHEHVSYKAGYDVGPANPFPLNEVEEDILEKRNRVEREQLQFQRLKDESERERRLRPYNCSINEEDAGEERRVDDNNQADQEPNCADAELTQSSHNMFVNLEASESTNVNSSENTNETISESVEVASEGVEINTNKNDKENKEELPHSPSSVEPPNSVHQMALNAALQVESQRGQERPPELQGHEVGEEKTSSTEHCCQMEIYTLDELVSLEQSQSVSTSDTPLPFEVVQSNLEAQHKATNQSVLDSYWQFVLDKPKDYNGWAYLLQYVEYLGNIGDIRKAYNAFLTAFPYCYTYWQRYSDLESHYLNPQRSLAILRRALEALPLSTELWLSYLQVFHNLYEKIDDFPTVFRKQCESAISTVGLHFDSDAVWSQYIEWEEHQGSLKSVTELYRRVIGVPTRLYNRHWDNFVAHVRDHHPRDILQYDHYENIREQTCSDLNIVYRPDPEPTSQAKKTRTVVMPEDKLKSGMKERILAELITMHEESEKAVEERMEYEEAIKVDFYDLRPLDLRQLKNWNTYLDFEVSKCEHERIVVLFERALVPCANYEHFWIKYANYLEDHMNKVIMEPTKGGKGNVSKKRGVREDDSTLTRKARMAFDTGLQSVDDIREKRCTWTLKGFKTRDKDGNEIMMAEENKSVNPISEDSDKEVIANDKNGEEEGEKGKETVITEKDKSINACMDEEQEKTKSDDVNDKVDNSEESHKNVNDENSGASAGVSLPNVRDTKTENKKNDEENTTNSTKHSKGEESVRDVYRRACLVHCSKKVLIKLRWAAFEETRGHIEKAKDILIGVNSLYPMLLECCMQLIDLDRRQGNYDKVEQHYRRLLSKLPKDRLQLRSWLSMRLARFQHKARNNSDRALATLRMAIKKDCDNPELFAQVVDVCFQRTPIDTSRLMATFKLAMESRMSDTNKLEFVKRKVEMTQEFGDIKSYRMALRELSEYKKLCEEELRVRAKEKRRKEALEHKENEELAMVARANAHAALNSVKGAQYDGTLCSRCGGNVAVQNETPSTSNKESLQEVEGGEEEVVDLMDLVIPDDQEEVIKRNLEEKTKYKEVAPTWELNIETYGYGRKRKHYDPDYEHVESSKFREYERLESQGYDEAIKDDDKNKSRHIHAPGLGSNEATMKASHKRKLNPDDYVVLPKVPELAVASRSSQLASKRSSKMNTSTEVVISFNLPPEVSDPVSKPSVNVPDWFVEEGGELLLSDSANGKSSLHYWPKFLNEKGNRLMFNIVRKYCKWHQRQVCIGNQWRYETRLVAWYGPCDYSHKGLSLESNLNWEPRLLDMLKRINDLTKCHFNACFLNLYRNGHDMCAWHADDHPQLGPHPTVASVSLGAVRSFELHHKTDSNFMRFPLKPGSLLLLEGAVQNDWYHCVPQEKQVKEERINLNFRTMFTTS